MMNFKKKWIKIIVSLLLTASVIEIIILTQGYNFSILYVTPIIIISTYFGITYLNTKMDGKNYFEKQLKKCGEEKNHHQITLRESYNDYFEIIKLNKEGKLKWYQNVNGIYENSLSEFEGFFIYSYTAGMSSWINLELRNGYAPSSLGRKLFVQYLDQALKKLPSFNNAIVFREDEPSCSAIEIHDFFLNNKGKTFRLNHFLSTYKKNLYDLQEDRVLWKINTLNNDSLGKDVSKISDKSHEEEVLFNRGGCFHIKKVYMKNKVAIVELEETKRAFDFNLVKCYWLN